jgi:transposase
MKDTDLYSQILGLSDPWFIADIELDTSGGQVDVHVDHAAGVRWRCPTCGRELACRDHGEARVWRHLDTCQFKTFFDARVPRVECPDHGVLQVKVPWAEAKRRFTLLMERLIIDVLRECATVAGTCRLMRISWDEAWNVMDRAVRRGQARKKAKPARYVGIDEKAFRKGHDYMTLVCDLLGCTVEFVAQDRKTESLGDYYRQFTTQQLERIRAVAMDMWEPYFKATITHVPGAAHKIVHDRFHIMQHVGQAVDKVRRQEHRELLRQEDERLKGTKYIWLYREENLSDKHRPTLEALKATNLKVAKAWAMQESLSGLWSYLSVGWTRRFMKRWLTWVKKTVVPHAQSRGDARPTPGEHTDFLPASDHQRRVRRSQQQDHGHQAEGLRLPESGALQNRHLLLLRWVGPLSVTRLNEGPTEKPEGPHLRCSSGCRAGWR